MSRKITNIEIEAFRAYLGKQTFDFNRNELANLVVIYAPNGTGKTSFFDAVEWSLSGEISRISNNSRVKEIAEQEKGEILKNKYSHLKNGSVAINFSDGEHIKISTKKINGSRKTDYAAGETISITPILKLIETKAFIKKNILTHNQIDQFLRFENSKGRYEALRIFWDFNNDTDLYKDILSVVRETEHYKVELNKKLNSARIDLKKSIISNETLSKLKDLIQKYNFLAGGMGRTQVVAEKIEETLEKYLVEKNKTEKELLYAENKLKEFRQIYNEYKNNHQPYLKEREEIISVKIPEKESLLNIFKEIKSKQEKRDKLVYEKNNKNAELNKFRFINDFREEVNSIEENKNNILQTQSELNNRSGKKTENLTNIKESLLDKLKELETYKEKTNMYITKIEKLNQIKTQIDYKKEKTALEKEKDLLLENIRVINKTSKFYLNHKEALLNLLNRYNKDSSGIFLDRNFFSNKIQGLLEEIQMYSKEKLTLEKKVVIKEEEIESFKKIGTDLSVLKKIGMKIVQNSSSKSCPLCNQEFENFKILIDKIENEGSKLGELNFFLSNLTSMKKEISLIDEKIESKREVLKQSALIELKEVEGVIYSNEVKESKIEENLKIKMRQIDFIKSTLKGIEQVVEEFNFHSNNKDVNPSNVNSVILKIKNEMKKNQEEFKVCEKTISEKNLLINELENEISIIMDKVKQNQLTLNRYDNYEIYKVFKQYSNDITETDISFVNEKIKELHSQCKIMYEEINKLEEEILLLKLNVLSYDEEILLTDLKVLTNKLNKLEFNVKSFEEKQLVTFGKSNLFENENEYEKEIQNLNSDKEKLLKMIEVLSHITNTISGYVNNSLKKDKEKEVKMLESEIKNITKKHRKILEVKKEAHDYIKNNIENVFNLESINNIFQMIDPHPDFTEIYFKLDESLKDGELGLNIMCKDVNQEDGDTAPILYLSSAQINVLSLSIFLASAIENTVDFNTILMDDPIQHLDGINLLSFIDLIRIICFSLDKQLIISTHNQTFFNLCKRKIDPEFFPVQYFNLGLDINDVIKRNLK